MSKKSKKVKKASKSPEVPLRSSDASEVDAAVTSVTATAFTEETFDNRNLNWTAVAELVLAVLITQWEVLRRLFGTVELTLGQWALALVPAVVLVFIWELGKLIARRVTSPQWPRYPPQVVPEERGDMSPHLSAGRLADSAHAGVLPAAHAAAAPRAWLPAGESPVSPVDVTRDARLR